MDGMFWNIGRVQRALWGVREAGMRIDARRYSDRRDVPLYTTKEVAVYLGLKPSTLHTWFFGRDYTIRGEKRHWPKLAEPAATHNPHGPVLSFFNLAESHVLSATRLNCDFKISIPGIRAAIDYLLKLEPSPHPLISRYFETNGCDLFIRLLEQSEEKIVNVSKGGQLGLKLIMDQFLKRIDRDAEGWPIKIYPMKVQGTDYRQIVIMPTVGSGRPVIEGTGVRVQAIWSRAVAGETVQDLSDDYGIEPSTIERAIKYYSDTKAA